MKLLLNVRKQHASERRAKRDTGREVEEINHITKNALNVMQKNDREGREKQTLRFTYSQGSASERKQTTEFFISE